MKTILTAVIVFSAVSILSAGPLEITGTRIYPADYLKKNLNLYRFETGEINIEKVSSLIENFYRGQEYLLVKVYLIEGDDGKTRVHVDEGRLNRIIFHNLSGIDTLRVKRVFRLERKIFNRSKIHESFQEIADRFNFHKIRYELDPSPDYDENLFQLDHEFELAVIGATKLPFFDRYGLRYDLNIYIEKASVRDAKEDPDYRPGRFDYTLGLDFSDGLVPEIIYYRPDLYQKGDMFEAGVSTGIFYGLDFDLLTPPEFKFYQIESEYTLAPVRSEIFTPVLKSLMYQTSSNRSDLGLRTYNYNRVNFIAAPGLTLLKKLRIYTGLGLERIHFFGIKADSSYSDIPEIEKKINYYRLLEFQTRLAVIPVRLGNLMNKNVTVTYTYYRNNTDFHKYSARATWDYVLRYHSVFSLRGSYRLNRGDVPFHHEMGINNHAFRGRSGIYTNHDASIGNEYRTSVYREFLIAGVFCDYTIFKNSVHNDKGIQGGLAAGPTIRVLFLDQFEFYCHIARDIILPEKSTETLLSMSLSRRW